MRDKEEVFFFPPLKLVLGSPDLEELLPSKKVDTRGLVCPFPSFETAKLASASGPMDVIEIISDDKYAALNSIPTVLRLRGFEFAVFETTQELFCVKARKVLGSSVCNDFKSELIIK